MIIIKKFQKKGLIIRVSACNTHVNIVAESEYVYFVRHTITKYITVNEAKIIGVATKPNDMGPEQEGALPGGL